MANPQPRPPLPPTPKPPPPPGPNPPLPPAAETEAAKSRLPALIELPNLHKHCGRLRPRLGDFSPFAPRVLT
jgi:hypothetical protein